MNEFLHQISSQPMVVRYTTSTNSGVQPLNTSRHAIGYVVRGEKYIYDGDNCLHAKRGDIFFLGKGVHHIEDIAPRNSTFEQIVFYFTSEELKRIITSFSVSYNINITNDHCCSKCRKSNSIVLESTNYLKNFFENSMSYLYEEIYSHDKAAENIKMTELVYLIVSHEDCCLKNKLISCIDLEKTTFEQIIYSNIFNDISIDELSIVCNRSLTSFKKEFKRIFDAPPHQWFLRQRLCYSRLLLISTRKSIAEIGTECTFPNTSHFIKLFKRTYGDTPATYRHLHLQLANHSEQEPLSVELTPELESV